MNSHLWIHHRYHNFKNSSSDYSEGMDIEFDEELVSRLLKSYQRQASISYGSDSMWLRFFNDYQKKIHEIFLENNIKKAFEILVDPQNSYLFYGFDDLCLPFNELRVKNAPSIADREFDCLIRLAEALGAVSLENPENDASWGKFSESFPDDFIRKIEDKFQFEISFQSPYKGWVGLKSKKGLIHNRTLHAIYVVSKLIGYAKFFDKKNFNVCEIGPGLGRTAYWAHKLGVKDYSLVDLPMTTMSQGFYLSLLLGSGSVVLPWELRSNPDQIKIYHPDEYFMNKQRFDFTLNVDSITEFGVELAGRYLKKIEDSSDFFLSINHESNEYSVNQLISNKHAHLRYPFWIRNGYVEELYKIKLDIPDNIVN